MIPATIWTDGSCIVPRERRLTAGRGAGGYAAIVERGGYGWTRRGCVANTTSSAMELAAIVAGLRSIPNAVPTLVVTDCWQAPAIMVKRRDGLTLRRAEERGWLELVEQLERVDVTFQIIEKGEIIPQHQRAHSFARDEAKALLAAALTDAVHTLA